jgi:hypothetical protein
MDFGAWKPDESIVQERLAELMVKSCRSAMPGIEIVQITNQYSRKLPFVDRVDTRVWKHGMDWLPYVSDYYAELGECLILDSDIIVQKDLRRLKELNVDLAVPVRRKAISSDDGAVMNVQMGVCYSNNSDLWKEISKRVRKMERPIDRNWWGIQLVLWDMLLECSKGESKFNLKAVKHRDFNYTPQDEKDAPEDVWAIHYKGQNRKGWMLKKWGNPVGEVV